MEATRIDIRLSERSWSFSSERQEEVSKRAFLIIYSWIRLAIEVSLIDMDKDYLSCTFDFRKLQYILILNII
jgi:hypothetical protein